MTSHFLATLWLPWEVDLHVFIDKNRSKIATVIIFFSSESWDFEVYKNQQWSFFWSFLELIFHFEILFWQWKMWFFELDSNQKMEVKKAPKKAPLLIFVKCKISAFTGKKNHYHNYLRSFFRTFWKKVSRGSRRLADDYVESQIQNSHWLAIG